VIKHNGGRMQVSGNMTMATASALFKAGLQAEPGSNLVIDFAQLEKVDSSAVSLMLVWLREAKRNNVNLSFAHVPENLSSLSKLYGVAELLPLSTAE